MGNLALEINDWVQRESSILQKLLGYKPEHFSLKELIPKEVYKARGEKAWSTLDPRALLTLDLLRKRFGKCTVNTPWNNVFNESGLRTTDCKEFSKYSQHTFGRAFDCKFEGIDAHSVREYIKANPEEFMFITFLEEGENITWVHFDVRLGKDLLVWNYDTNKTEVIKRG